MPKNGEHRKGASLQGPTTAAESEARLSRPSVGRFSLYLRCVQRLHEEGARTISSGQLGGALGVTDTQVRKDLAYLGNLGHRGVGYPTQELITALRAALGVDRPWAVVLVGVGNLARALLRYRGFTQQGFHIVAAFDVDPGKVGQSLDGIPIHPLEDLTPVIAATRAELALLTVPAEVAQAVADQLVAAGIHGILNFAPGVLRLPAAVHLVSVDLAVQLEQLASLVHHGTDEAS
jgi:redox-sensing transcriptional repressor